MTDGRFVREGGSILNQRVDIWRVRLDFRGSMILLDYDNDMIGTAGR